MVALIPARAGSKRVVGKNVRPLNGHPLMAFTIRAAVDSGVFSDVLVSTDSEEYAEIARHYGAAVPFLRPAELAGEKSLDIEWLSHLLQALAAAGRSWEYFSLLRPTSPFRKPETIRRAAQEFLADGRADSLRAVERCKQHPGKMWVVTGSRMSPLLPLGSRTQPWHSTPYQALPEVYAQNASLEIARTSCVLEHGTIAGEVVMPFFTQGDEGHDVNDEEDWLLAELRLARGQATLPSISMPPFAR